MDSMADSGETRKPTRREEINVADLRRRLGERRQLEIDMMLSQLEVIATRSVAEPVIGSLMVESIERGVTITGSVAFGWDGECRRCLEPVAGRVDTSVMEIFQVNAPEDTDEISELVADTIDLVPVIRDAVLLGLPLAPLCGDDCAGPDPDRYPAVTEEQQATMERPLDPRWSALADLDLTGE